jgi:DNA glycosylase AlkZ-like
VLLHEVREDNAVVTTPRLGLSREQVLAHRRRAGELDERLPPGRASLERAAWAGLQDSMPRAAVLSIHARVAETHPTTWEDPALVQMWGPRFSAYVIAARDRAVFTLGRLPAGGRGLHRAEDIAARLHAFLDGRRMRYDEAGRGIGVHPNALRYAAPTGTVLMRWEGARLPVIWNVPRPEIDPGEARLELARRYLHVFGPTTPAAFAKWAGIGAAEGRGAFDSLGEELMAVRTPVGDGWILTSDERSLLGTPSPAAPARLLPSGDAYFLLHGVDRELLVPDEDKRNELWTSRVWPGAVLVGGEIVGTWRRAGAVVAIQTWRRLSAPEREAVEAEAESLPLPGLSGQIVARWDD